MQLHLDKIAPDVFTKPKRSVNKVYIHCTAIETSRASNGLRGRELVQSIDRYHRGLGWKCIGYHYVIDVDGSLWTARPLEMTPAAQAGHNNGTIAIALNGLSTFTTAQFEALRTLCHSIRKTISGISFHGHSEVSDKACPVFDYRAVLSLDKSGKMQDEKKTPQPRVSQTTFRQDTTQSGAGRSV